MAGVRIVNRRRNPPSNRAGRQGKGTDTMGTRNTLFGLVVYGASILGIHTAFAGEITGNGKWIAGSPDAPLNGKSECAFSGQQDDPGEPPFRGLIAQSWGQIPKAVRDFLTSIGMNPGISCNPTKATGGEPN
jgi:hypothetical protein